MTLSCTLVMTFFKFQNELKLYHWRTHDYSRHKASDKLQDKMLDLIDVFIEAYMGEFGRVSVPRKDLHIRIFTDKTAPKLLQEMIHFLTTLDKPLKSKPSLLNIRDEMVATIQRTLYLFTLD